MGDMGDLGRKETEERVQAMKDGETRHVRQDRDLVLAGDEPMLQFFSYRHLPPELQGISRNFADLAEWVAQTFPRNPERTVCLRKLLEAKDCAVRARIYRP